MTLTEKKITWLNVSVLFVILCMFFIKIVNDVLLLAHQLSHSPLQSVLLSVMKVNGCFSMALSFSVAFPASSSCQCTSYTMLSCMGFIQPVLSCYIFNT